LLTLTILEDNDMNWSLLLGYYLQIGPWKGHYQIHQLS
jgi:hypothetical protein